jgi:hypothetical protein
MHTTEDPSLEKSLDEITGCRAASMGAQGFGECLCEGPNACPYALPFGYAFLCQHPRVKEIIEHTKQPTQAAHA